MGILYAVALILSRSKETDLNFKNTTDPTTEVTIIFIAAKQGLVYVVTMRLA